MCMGLDQHQAMSPMEAAGSWGKSYADRQNAPDPNAQRPAGIEHRAFARHTVNDRPLLGVPTMLASIPAYNGAKAVGLLEGGSEPSLNSMAQAYRGVGEGVADLFKRNFMGGQQ